MPGSLVVARSYVYVVQSDIEHVLSANGLKSRLDERGDGVVDYAAMNEGITEASETVDYYCFSKYDPSILATSNWANRAATWLATYCVCGFRASPVPDI